MLKKVLVNNKKVPVPVPVLTLDDALRWIESTLVPAGHTITRIALDDRLVGDYEGSADDIGRTRLGPDSRLEVQIDSPVDLAIQTLDAMRNLASVVLSGLKPLAVECWQARPTTKPEELDAVCGDMELVLDLIDHVSGLMEPMSVDAAAIQGISAMIKRASVGLTMARSHSDWRACAKLLLNKLEPLLKDLVAESENLQIRVMTSSADPASTKAKLPTG
jgi:hypothetical protein